MITVGTKDQPMILTRRLLHQFFFILPPRSSRIAGNLAGRYLAVPNLINIVAKQQYQGVGETESQAVQDCLKKIKGLGVVEIFPEKEE